MRSAAINLSITRDDVGGIVVVSRVKVRYAAVGRKRKSSLPVCESGSGRRSFSLLAMALQASGVRSIGPGGRSGITYYRDIICEAD